MIRSWIRLSGYQKDEEKLNYAAEVRQLRQEGPKPLYFLWGPEDYLCEQYRAELKSLMAKAAKDGKTEEVKALLKALGVTKLSQIPDEKVGEALQKAGEI